MELVTWRVKDWYRHCKSVVAAEAKAKKWFIGG